MMLHNLNSSKIFPSQLQNVVVLKTKYMLPFANFKYFLKNIKFEHLLRSDKQATKVKYQATN